MANVTPYAGVWIEIRLNIKESFLPYVTPYAGVWIEIGYTFMAERVSTVTPYAGVWIEMAVLRSYNYAYRSLPTRECGLKLILC